MPLHNFGRIINFTLDVPHMVPSLTVSTALKLDVLVSCGSRGSWTFHKYYTFPLSVTLTPLLTLFLVKLTLSLVLLFSSMYHILMAYRGPVPGLPLFLGLLPSFPVVPVSLIWAIIVTRGIIIVTLTIKVAPNDGTSIKTKKAVLI